MENPIDQERITDALVKMRAMLIHRMKAPHCSPMMYNECRSHVLQIDQQLVAKRVTVSVEPIPYRTWTRAQMRKHKRAAGTTFTQRTLQRAGNKK